MDNPQILIVEDDADLRRILSLQLERLGYRVAIAADGREGFEMAKDLQPDLVLLDLMMPEMDGFQLLKRLKVMGPLAKTPVVILTASQDDNHRKKGMSHYASGFLTKPYKMDKLKEVVERLLTPNLTSN